MAKIKLVLELDDGDAYDNEVAGILRSTPEAGRKELVTSAILYFVRSPSFRLADKMDKVLTALEGGAQISHQSYAKAPTIHHAPEVAEKTPPPRRTMHKFPTQAAPYNAATVVTVPATSTDGADDIFAAMAEQFR